jgi:hypothetical protein
MSTASPFRAALPPPMLTGGGHPAGDQLSDNRASGSVASANRRLIEGALPPHPRPSRATGNDACGSDTRSHTVPGTLAAVPACPHCRPSVAIVAWLVPPAAANVTAPHNTPQLSVTTSSQTGTLTISQVGNFAKHHWGSSASAISRQGLTRFQHLANCQNQVLVDHKYHGQLVRNQFP